MQEAHQAGTDNRSPNISRYVTVLVWVLVVTFSLVIGISQWHHWKETTLSEISATYHLAIAEHSLAIMEETQAVKLWFRDRKIAVGGSAQRSPLHILLTEGERIDHLLHTVEPHLGRIIALQIEYADPRFSRVTDRLKRAYEHAALMLQGLVEQPSSSVDDIDRACSPMLVAAHQLQRLHKDAYSRLDRKLNDLNKREPMMVGGVTMLLFALGFVVVPRVLRHVRKILSERDRAEAEVVRSEERVRLLLNSTAEAIYGLDLQGTCTFANPACVAMLGYSDLSELLGKDMHGLVHHTRVDGSPYPVEDCRVSQAVQKGTGIHGDDEVLWRKDGTSFPVEYWAHPMQGAGSVVTFLDITERKRAEDQLNQAYARLQQLTIQLTAAEEEERKRIARELHDEFGQILTGLKFDLTWLGKQLKAEAAGREPALQDKVRAMLALVDTTIASVQRVTASLRPGILDDLGLAAAVEWLGQGLDARTGCRCKVEVSPRVREMPINADRGLALFRIAQELLTNVMRHAQASSARLSLTEEGGDLILTVKDNGRGITEVRVEDPLSLGLRGIRERVSLLGGQVSIQGQRGKGTTVTVRAPVG